ncbi:unnamed protein product [Arctogadus glacialis]
METAMCLCSAGDIAVVKERQKVDIPYILRKRSQRPSDRDTHWAWQDTPWDTRLEPGASARLPHLIHIKAGTGDIEEDDTEMHK